jgi:hypothetical protein
MQLVGLITHDHGMSRVRSPEKSRHDVMLGGEKID